MPRSLMEWILGDLDEKRAYYRIRKRVKALPENYGYAYHKMLRYIMNVSGGDAAAVVADITLYEELAAILEDAAAQGKPVSEVFGGDVSAFCDDYLRALSADKQTTRDRLNRETLAALGEKEGSL